ncbi:MAG TPA: hypothetical protein DD856_19020, partial [Sulfobacillus sp.]|nr:hypothetical protein [Sulfobacillus sp.]
MGQGEEVLAFANAWPGQAISISSFVRKKGGHRDFIRLGTVRITAQSSFFQKRRPCPALWGTQAHEKKVVL